MSEKVIAGVNVTLDEQGYMTDLNQWNKEIAIDIASEEGVDMGDRQWELIHWIQEQYRKDVPLSIRKIGKSGVVSIKEFYQLFPEGPLKKASRIAGIPKPKSCI